jgi:hypothetical protein
LNGSLIKQWSDSDWSGAFSSSLTSPFTLGLARPGDSDYGDFDGRIDEFKVYTRTLSPEQIAQNYSDGNSGKGGPTEIVYQEHTYNDTWQLKAYELTGEYIGNIIDLIDT